MGWDNRVHELITSATDTKRWALYDRLPLEQWTEGRITLLGDAAHAMTQNMAQGGAMAIEDAIVLADKLLHSPNDIAAAFVAYQNERYLRTTRVQLCARLYGEAMHLTGAEAELRNGMFKALDPRKNLEAFAWLYEGLQVSDKAARRLAG